MKNLGVVLLSEWLSNPYKDLLSKHLEMNGLRVWESLWKTFFIPLVIFTWKPSILHLQALHPFLRGRSALSKFLKLWLFVGQILLLRLLGIKTIWTVHEWTDKLGTGSSDIPPSHAAIIGRVLHSFITHCESTQKEIVEAFQLSDPSKVHVISHGNYIGFYENRIDQQQARKLLGIPTEHVTFLIFGGLYRYKGVLEALKAFKDLDSDQVTLIIAGQPSQKGLKEEIETEIQTSSKKIVFVPERIPDEDVQIYMNACDCVVVPYKVFTTSGVAILAMSFQRICIAPRMGFFYDVFKDDGAFLYDVNQSDGLTRAMSQAVDNYSEILLMAKRNLELAEQWTWNSVASETISVYGS